MSVRIFLVILALGLSALPARAVVPFARIQNYQALDGAPPSLVRLYLIPTSPVHLDWSTPRKLLLTTIEASLINKDHPIGHVAIEVQYRGLEDAEHHIATGASGSQSGISRQLLLKDDLAFSILERAWPGMLENPDDLAVAVRERAPHKNRLAVVTWLISDASCQRMLDYYHALVADQNPRYYGFGARPRRGEGSGCSAFGASFLEQAGLVDAPLRAAWTLTVRVPLNLMAGYLGNARIPLKNALASRHSAHWAAPADPHMLLELFDPDVMYRWATHLHATPGDSSGLLVQPDLALPRLLDSKYQLNGAAERNVPAIVIDARDVPTPTTPIFLGPPSLKPMTDTQSPTVIREDKVVSPNGSFEVRP